jgi:hypothetical protein
MIKKRRQLSVILFLGAFLSQGCVVTTRTYAPRLIVTTYHYRDIWVVDCLSKIDADSILALISSSTTMPILKITYSFREIAKVKDGNTKSLPCSGVDVFTGVQNGQFYGRGVAFDVEKVNGAWVLKGSYKWSM